MFYNTTQEPQEKVDIFKKRNESQDEIVLGIFQEANRPLGASDVYKRYPVSNVPITSLRRAITDLSKEGFLEDTKEIKKGLYGRGEKIWKLIG